MNDIVREVYDKCYINGFQRYFEKTALVSLRGIGSASGNYGSSIKPFMSESKPGVTNFLSSNKFYKQNPKSTVGEYSNRNKAMSTLKDNVFFSHKQ